VPLEFRFCSRHFADVDLAKCLTGDCTIVLTDAEDWRQRHRVVQGQGRSVGQRLRTAGGADQGRLEQ